MSNSWELIVVMALMTSLLRFLPFLLLRFTRNTPKLVIHLGQVLPQAAIGMLVVYCLRNTTLSDRTTMLATVAAAAAAVLLQAKLKNIVYTVIGATALYMVLLHF